MQRIRTLVALVPMLLLVGCLTTMQDVVDEHAEGGGTSATYSVGMEDAWSISKIVFRWEDCHTVEEHRDAGYMLASNARDESYYTSSGPQGGVTGALMGAWLTAVNESTTEVTVVTKPAAPLYGFLTALAESTYHKRFREAVVIVQSGEPLPADSP